MRWEAAGKEAVSCRYSTLCHTVGEVMVVVDHHGTKDSRIVEASAHYREKIVY